MNHLSEFTLVKGGRAVLNLDNIRHGEVLGASTSLFHRDTLERAEVEESLLEVMNSSCGYMHLFTVKSTKAQTPFDREMVINQKFVGAVSKDPKSGNAVLEMMSPAENYLTTVTYGQAVAVLTLCAAPSGGGTSASPVLTTVVGGAVFKYEIASGVPVISFSKVGGVATMSVVGGTIKLKRFSDLALSSEIVGGSIRYDLVGVGTLSLLECIPHSVEKRTINAPNASADASSDVTVSNQFDKDNTPRVLYGNLSVAGQGSVAVRFDIIPGGDLGVDMIW